jgi:hypothetical protein
MKLPVLVLALLLGQAASSVAVPLSSLIASENTKLKAKIAAYKQQCGEEPGRDEKCVKIRYELGGDIGKFVVLAHEELALLEPAKLSPDVSLKDRRQFAARRSSIEEMVRFALDELKSLGIRTSKTLTTATSPAASPVPELQSIIKHPPNTTSTDQTVITERVNTFFSRHQVPEYKTVEAALRKEYLAERFRRERAQEDKNPELVDGDSYTLSDGGWDVGAIRVISVQVQGERADASVSRGGINHNMKVSLVKERGKWMIDRIFFAH